MEIDAIVPTGRLPSNARDRPNLVAGAGCTTIISGLLVRHERETKFAAFGPALDLGGALAQVAAARYRL